MISVIIPVYNCSETIEECLNAVLKCILNGDEIIVVNDGSTDNTAEILKKFDITVINQINKGPAAARNAGAAAAKNKILLFIDGDIIISKNVLSNIKDSFDANKAIDGFIGGFCARIRYKDISSRLKNLYLNYFLFSKVPEFARKGMNSSIFTIKKQIFIDNSGFNENMKEAIVEDMEFGIRLAKNNNIIVHNSKLEVEHNKKLNLVKFLKTDYLKSKIAAEFMLFHYKKKSKKNSSAVFHPLSNNLFYYFSIPFSFLMVISFCAAYFFKPIFFCLIFTVSYILWLLLNIGFIKCIKKNYGFIFTLKSIPAIVLDQITMGLGIISGVTNFIFNKNQIKKIYEN